MIPKKIRRTIIVDKQEWEYCVKGRYEINIFLHNLTTNEKIKWYAEGEGTRITPKDIRTLIETKELMCIKAT
jgi:hypothetical protein